MLIIAAYPRHLGARIGITAVLHSWGSALTHHPHIHMIVPSGISLDGQRWVSSRLAFLLPVRVLGKLFRRLFLTRLTELLDAGQLRFFGRLVGLNDTAAFRRHLASTRMKPWIVYAKPPFARPAAVLAYLSRYTHRVAISNRQLIAVGERGVTFGYKDYCRDGAERYRTMTLPTDEFIRRFLLLVLPRGFHRIRHYGLLASGTRRHNLARVRELLAVPPPPAPEPDAADLPTTGRPAHAAAGATLAAAISRENDVVTRPSPIYLQIAALLRSGVPLATDATKAVRPTQARAPARSERMIPPLGATLLRLASCWAEKPTMAIIDNRTPRSTPGSGTRAGYDSAKRKRGSKMHTAVDTRAICSPCTCRNSSYGRQRVLVAPGAPVRPRDQPRLMPAKMSFAPVGAVVALVQAPAAPEIAWPLGTAGRFALRRSRVWLGASAPQKERAAAAQRKRVVSVMVFVLALRPGLARGRGG